MDPPKSTSLMSALGDKTLACQLVHIADENILRLQIAVNDVVRVDERERLENLLEELGDTGKCEVGGQRWLFVDRAHEIVEILLKKLQ